MPFLFQVKQHLDRKMERDRERERQREINFFADIKFSSYF